MLRFSQRSTTNRTGRKHANRRPRRATLQLETLENRMVLATLNLAVLGTYDTGHFGEAAAEIVAHDPVTQRLFVCNVADQSVDVLDMSDPTNPTLAFAIDITPYGAVASNVDVRAGVVAVSVIADPRTDPGKVVFFDTAGNALGSVGVGAGPDMLTYTPDGRKIVVANEGEPSDDYTIDPEGSVSIIDVSGGVASATVTTASFAPYNNRSLPGVRIYGPKVVAVEGTDPETGEPTTTLEVVGRATVAQDLEPEFVTISPDSRRAFVTLQENNAIAEVDLRNGRVTAINGLGYKVHALPGNGMDASDRDDGINIKKWPVLGMYQPDAIASYMVGGQLYLLTANEGDARDWDGYSEVARIADLNLGLPMKVLDRAGPFRNFTAPENMGRLRTTTAAPFGMHTNRDGEDVYGALFSHGARSFSVWSTSGHLVFDSGDDLEQITADLLPDSFNSDEDSNDSFDSRSDDKGPEPEALVLGAIGGRTYAFVGLERIGGIMVYDVTDPRRPRFETYVNNRDFSEPDEIPAIDDEGNPIILPVYDDDGNPVFVQAVDENGEPIFDEEGNPVFEELPAPTALLGPDGEPVLDDDGNPVLTSFVQATETVMVHNPAMGDLAPEGLKFIPAAQSPTGRPLLVTANEVSGTTTIFEITIGSPASAAAAVAIAPSTVSIARAENAAVVGRLQARRDLTASPSADRQTSASTDAVDVAITVEAATTNPRLQTSRAARRSRVTVGNHDQALRELAGD